MPVIESSTSPTRENINKRSYRKLFETIMYFIVTRRLSVTVLSKATCSVSCQSNCPDTVMCTVTEGQRLCTVMPMSMMPKALCVRRSVNCPWRSQSVLCAAMRQPQNPENLHVNVSAYAITLSWSPPNNIGVPVLGYIVGHGRYIPEVYRSILGPSVRDFTITDLSKKRCFSCMDYEQIRTKVRQRR